MLFESDSIFEIVPVKIHATAGRDHPQKKDQQHTHDMQNHWDPSTPDGLLDHSSGDTHRTDVLRSGGVRRTFPSDRRA